MFPQRRCLADLPGDVPRRSNQVVSRVVRLRTRLTTSLALIVVGWSFTSQVKGQSLDSAKVVRGAERTDLQSNQPRPMDATVTALVNEFGWLVDYEDPPYSKNSSDVVDMTDPTWQRTHPHDRFFGLKGGSFLTHLAPTETASEAVPVKTVERIVSEYDQSSLPGRFIVRTGERGRIAVVGVATRNASDAYEQTPVLLDTPIVLTPLTTDLLDALSTITAALTSISGHRVVVGTSPINLFNQVQCVLPSEKLVSRVAIGQMLDSAPVKLVYSLLYDPNDDLYVLNVTVVTRVSVTAHGDEKSIVPQQKK
jgi:hypothetical protein